MPDKPDFLTGFHKAGEPVPEETHLPLKPEDARSLIRASVESLKLRIIQKKMEQKEQREQSQPPSRSDSKG